MSTNLDAIRSELGQPCYDRENILLYQGDCYSLMKRLVASRFPLTITSPPYNIGKPYETELAVDEYVTWCERWIGEIARLTKNGGAFWLNLGYLSMPGRAKAIPIPYLLWNRVPLFLMQEVVWNYGAGVACRKSFSPRNEKFLWYVQDPDNYIFNLDAVRDPNVKYPNQKKNGKLKCNPLGKNPTDVWQFPKVTSGENRSSKERTAHPAQFPVAVIDRIVKSCSSPGDIILDPFMGSGTVAEVAAMNGRKAVGFELNQSYIETAIIRLDKQFERRTENARQAELFNVG